MKSLFHKVYEWILYKCLSVSVHRSLKMYNQKGTTVVCVYCGKLMPKAGATFNYIINADRVEYSHDECYQAANPVQEVILKGNSDGECNS